MYGRPRRRTGLRGVAGADRQQATATVMVGLVTLVYGVVGTAEHGVGSGRTLLLFGVALV
jgi:hypothetical protein